MQMLKRDLVKMAGGNLARRKSRTVLTVLGIVIGVVSLVLMVSVGLGMRETFEEEIKAGMSSINVIEVQKGADESTTRLAENDDSEMIEYEDIQILSQINGVEAVSPVITDNVQIISGKYSANVSMVGINPELMEVLAYEVEEGRLLSFGDEYEIVFGSSVVDQFRELEEGAARGKTGGKARFTKGPMGKPKDTESTSVVNVFFDRMDMTFDKNYNPQASGKDSKTDAEVKRVKGIGILSSGDMTRDRNAYMDINTLSKMKDRYNELTDSSSDEGYDKAYVKVKDMDDVEDIISVIEDMGYETFSSTDFLDTLQQTTDMIQIVLGIIGAVSLLVAAIGITNTMIMAIYERKREIGIMKVIGASLKEIKRLFLLESALIGLIGGIVGTLFSFLGSFIISYLGSGGASAGGARSKMGMMSMTTSFKSSMPVWLVISSIVFSMLIGLIAGYIPANKAMKSSALEAIKTE